MRVREKSNLMGNFLTTFLVVQDGKKVQDKNLAQSNPAPVQAGQVVQTYQPKPQAQPQPQPQPQIPSQGQPQGAIQQPVSKPIQTTQPSPLPPQMPGQFQRPPIMTPNILPHQIPIQNPQNSTPQGYYPQQTPPNMPPQISTQPGPRPPQGPQQFPQQRQIPNQQQIILPQHQFSGPDPYLQPYHNIPEAKPFSKTELDQEHNVEESTVEPTTETFSFAGSGKDVVEHDVVVESVVEAPNLETATFNLSSASVIEVKEQSVYEEKDEIIVHGADDKEKDIWKPPDANEE